MKYIISSALYLAILLALSEFVFNPANLYFEIPWLDIPMHLMGGFGVASLVMSVASYYKKKTSLLTVILLVLLVAVGWELYEFIHDVIVHKDWGGWSDTISDIINGLLGALTAFYFFRK